MLRDQSTPLPGAGPRAGKRARQVNSLGEENASVDAPHSSLFLPPDPGKPRPRTESFRSRSDGVAPVICETTTTEISRSLIVPLTDPQPAPTQSVNKPTSFVPRKRSRELSSTRLHSDLLPRADEEDREDDEEGADDVAVVDHHVIPLQPHAETPRGHAQHPRSVAVQEKCIQGVMGPPVNQMTVYPFPLSDDIDGHIVYRIGDGLAPTAVFPQGRYRILGLLGEGTFGKVLKCWDYTELATVAIKVVRAIPKYREAARVEVEVLNHLDKNDPEDWYHCVKLLSWFEYRGHVCMAFEKLGLSLYDVLRKREFRPFSLDQVREYAWQLLESVQFLHSLALIHTDLKPENILHDDQRSTSKRAAIKLIDFGSATFDFWKHNDVVSTRHYRAPEVILGGGWTYSCDLWSVGCILAELYTGEVLFQTHHDLEHLALMTTVLGPVPTSLSAHAGSRSRKKFFRKDSAGRLVLNWPEGAASVSSVRAVGKTRRLCDMVQGAGEQTSSFLDLLNKLLAFEPGSRCTPSEALRHPFLHGNFDSDRRTMSSGSSASGVESLSNLSVPAFSRKCLIAGAGRVETGPWSDALLGAMGVARGSCADKRRDSADDGLDTEN